MDEKPSWRSIGRDVWDVVALVLGALLLVMAAIDTAGGHYAEATLNVALVILFDRPRR